MFGGIIQNQGQVTGRKAVGDRIRFKIRFKKPEKNIKLGESIAVNGVCLTVTEKKNGSFAADVIPETLKATTLGQLTAGRTVNLERALRFGDRIGGHFIQGHVDGVGQIQKIEKSGQSQVWTLKAPGPILKKLALKGSVALDGISLTVQSVKQGRFKISLIPHTLKETTLHGKKPKDTVNIEVDMLARYASRGSQSGKSKSVISKKIKELKRQGF